MGELSNWQWFIRCLTHRHQWSDTKLHPHDSNMFIRYCQDEPCPVGYQTRRWREGPWPKPKEGDK